MNLTMIKQKFFVASNIIERYGGDEEDLAKMFGKVRGKQLYNLTQIDRYFPHLGTRFASQKVIENLDYKKLATLAKRAEKGEATEEEVGKMFGIRERPNRCKMMNRNNIEALAMTCEIKIIADTARAIAENNVDVIFKYLERAEAINEATK